ncbi:MAG: PKD domain-containing protein [Chitinophagaceae bacterium]
MTNGAFSAPFNIPANGIQEIQVPHALAHIDATESGLIIQKSIRIKTDPGKPAVVAYAQLWGNARSAASLLLPVNVLGKKYLAISFTQNGTNSGAYIARSQIHIIATKPNTNVRVTPRQNGVTGTPFVINFTNAGDMYQYQATQDITGTLIESLAGAGGCLPIAVFSGSSNVTFGTNTCTNQNSSDPLFQQVYPVSTWGKNFGFIPFSSYPAGNPYRVMASEPNTSVYFDGVLVATLANAGDIYPAAFTSNPVVITSPTYITANKPICVAQYAQRQNCSGATNPQGDPDMVILNPIEQNIQDITIFSSSQQNIAQQWVNILLKTVAVPSFRINGALPTAFWQTFTPLPGYSYLRQQFPSPGSYRLAADSGFNAIAYGWGTVESYSYSAGTNVKDLYQQIGVSTDYGIEPTPSVCTNSPFKFKVSLPYCADSIRWNLSSLPGPPAQPPLQVYNTCVPGPGGPDSTSVINGVTIYWYSLPSSYSFSTSGIFPVTLTVYSPNTDGCGSEQEIEFELSVSAPPAPGFTWTPGGCVAEPFQFTETTPQTPKPTYRWWWDFGDPSSGPANNSLLRNPTHIFTAPGTYTVRYAAITTPGCLLDTISNTVTVAPLPSASISGAATVCVNSTPAPLITFTGADGTPGYTFTYTINGGAPQTIQTTGTNTSVTLPVPTTTPGTFRYTITEISNTGSTTCKQTQNVFVDVVIQDDATVTLTSAVGTDNQTVCINTPITNITYAIGGSGTGGSVSGLPAGVTGSFAGGVITITGIPTVSGTFNYTVTTTGPCLTPTVNGTINVTADGTVALTSPAGTDNQTVCINTPIASITYAVGGSSTGGTVSGLPAGVNGVYAGGVITISGTPSVSGTFNYTVNTTGPCVNPTANGALTVTADGTITLTSAPGTNNQTLCINVPIVNITYSVGGSGTGGSVTGLPAGVTGNFAGGIITISGTPTVSGTFNYTVNTTGPCINPTATGTITVNPDASLTLTSAPPTTNQELCATATLTNITYSVGGTGTGATVTGLPAGVTGVFAGGIVTISGVPTASGVFNYTVTTSGICVPATATGTITVNALPTANFSASVPSCETGLINFTDLSVANTGTIVSWAWDFGDGGTSTLQNPSHTYAAAGTYNVTLVVTTDKGCISTNPSQQVTVYAKPLAGFIIPEVCLNDTYAQFTDTSQVAAPDNIAQWAWDFGDGGTSTLQNPQHSYTATGSYVVQLIVTSNRGCRDTVIHNLFVNGSFPNANFTVLNPTQLCANDSVAIVEASTVFPGTITKVEIYWDNVGQPGVFDTDNFPVTGKVYKHLYPNFQTPLTRTFTIRYRAYSGGVCVNDKLSNITVNAAPKVQFNPIPNICLDAAPYQITQATETGGVPGTGVFSGPGVSPTGLFNPAVAGAGTHTIKYLYTSATGGCQDSLTQTIKVWEAAVADFSVSTPACERQSVTFTDNSNSTEGSITQWRWNFSDGSPILVQASGNPVTHSFAGYGTYNVILNVVTSNGCVSPQKVIPVDVKPLARPNFTFPAIGCLPNANVTFTNTSSIPDGTQASFTYLWNFGDPGSGGTNTSTATNPSHVYAAVGPYNVNLQVTSGAGCIHDTTIILNSIHPQPLASISSDKIDVCIGGSISFSSVNNPMDGTTIAWNWDLDDGNIRTTPMFVYTYAVVGVYDVTHYITNSFNCRSNTATLTVSVNPYPPVNAGPDKFMLEGGQVMLTPTVNVSYPVTYSWTPAQYLDNPNVATPIARPPDDQYFTLLVTSDKGCSASDEVFVKVLKKPDIPNIFSPNGDGVHDRWEIKYLDSYPGCTVDIVNRYGQLVYHSVGYTTPWDGKVNGKDAPIGTYYYVVDPKNGRKPITGYVDIIR